MEPTNEVDADRSGSSLCIRVRNTFPDCRSEMAIHFGQTQINDFGRPYGQGWNTVNGFSSYSTWGRWTGYFRGEWQASSGLPALSADERVKPFSR